MFLIPIVARNSMALDKLVLVSSKVTVIENLNKDAGIYNGNTGIHKTPQKHNTCTCNSQMWN